MYLHLNREQRLDLGFLLREGYSLRRAAGVLGVSHSTLSRELSRNGSNQTAVGYHAGDARRRTRKRQALRLLPQEDFGAAGFAAAIKNALGFLPGKYLKTLTLDNDPEMALPERIERQTGLTVCYATPYHSWERGCNENANGLLRCFFPEKSSFASLTPD